MLLSSSCYCLNSNQDIELKVGGREGITLSQSGLESSPLSMP